MNWPMAIASVVIFVWVLLIWIAIYHGAEVDNDPEEDYYPPAESREHE